MGFARRSGRRYARFRDKVFDNLSLEFAGERPVERFVEFSEKIGSTGLCRLPCMDRIEFLPQELKPVSPLGQFGVDVDELFLGFGLRDLTATEEANNATSLLLRVSLPPLCGVELLLDVSQVL
jgi:hypothetical protein